MGHKMSSTKHCHSVRRDISTSNYSKHETSLISLQKRFKMLACLKLWLLEMCQTCQSQPLTYSDDSLTKALTVLLTPLAEKSKEKQSSTDKEGISRAYSATCNTCLEKVKQTLSHGCHLSGENNKCQITLDELKQSEAQRNVEPKGSYTSLSETSCSVEETSQHTTENECKKMLRDVVENSCNKETVREDMKQSLRDDGFTFSVKSQKPNKTSCCSINLKTNQRETPVLRYSMMVGGRIRDSALPEVKFDLKEVLLTWIRSSTETDINHNSLYTVCPVHNRDASSVQQPADETLTIHRFEPLMTVINRIADGERVPPQTTMKYEMLRFCTLRSYPKQNKPYITRLAQAGFYYTNSGDEVVCYSCARRRRNWRETDIPMTVHREMNPNCSFLTRNSEVNVPVRTQSQHDLGTNRIQQVQNPHNTDETRGTNLRNNVNNNPELGEATGGIRAVPTVGGVTMQAHAGRLSTAYENPNRNTTVTENNANPKYPKYVSKIVRLTSFTDCSEIVVTPERLAEAGFFYAGFGDCVRCFQCGVGLRHWSEEDDPWIEHSRWSKECSFVRQIRGSEFVNLVQMAVQYSQHQNREEQAPVRQESNTTTSSSLSAAAAAAATSAVTATTATSNDDQSDMDTILLTDAALSVLEMGYSSRIVRKAARIITDRDGSANITAASLMEQIFVIEEVDDPQTSVSRDEETGDNQTQNTQVAGALETIHRDDIQRRSEYSRNERVEVPQNLNEQPASYVEEIYRYNTDNPSDSSRKNERQETEDCESHQCPVLSNSSLTESEESSASTSRVVVARRAQLQEQKRLKEENQKLKGQSTCTKCKKNEVCIVFLPCGHLVTCENCAPTVRYCTESTCGKYIKGTVRTYLA